MASAGIKTAVRFFLAFGLLSVSKKEGPDATRLTMPLFSVPLAQWLERWSYEP